MVVRALYGEMPERVDVYRTLREQAFGEVIDVTKPVQYLVRDSKILVPGGASKVMLKGFYDPVNGYPKVLAIRYMFMGRLHQAVVNDFDRIRVPCQGTRPVQWSRASRPAARTPPTCFPHSSHLPPRLSGSCCSHLTVCAAAASTCASNVSPPDAKRMPGARDSRDGRHQ